MLEREKKMEKNVNCIGYNGSVRIYIFGGMESINNINGYLMKLWSIWRNGSQISGSGSRFKNKVKTHTNVPLKLDQQNCVCNPRKTKKRFIFFL